MSVIDSSCIFHVCFSGCLFLLSFLSDPVSAMNGNMSGNSSDSARHIVLLGASVGKAWSISGLPDRIGNSEYTFEYAGEYSADKSEKLASILDRGQEKPDAIIIKECAAFFPGASEKLKPLIRDWVGACRDEGVIPVLATVVPVVRSFPLRVFFLNLLHGKWRYPKGVFEAIIEFNDWVRDYAGEEGLVVLDLEAALRTSSCDRHLNGRYARKDGLHINEKAYMELDRIVIPAMNMVEFPERRNPEK